MITEFEKMISLNQVASKSKMLWWKVEKKLMEIIPIEERNDQIFPHKRLTVLESKMDKLQEEILALPVIINKAVMNTLNENEVTIRPIGYSSADEKEQSYNNELERNECFVQHFSYLMATEDINKFNSLIDKLNEEKVDSTVDELVYAIGLIENYCQLLKKIEEVKGSKSIEEVNKLNENLKLKDNIIGILLKDKTEKEVQKETMITGFTCNLHPETVKEIYTLMAGKEYLSSNFNDFQAIFSNVSIPVENPLKWKILNKRGKNAGRGNQTALFVFLKIVLGTVSNADLKKCKDLFIDENGNFIEKDLLRPDKEKIKDFGFETRLNEILKKADQQN